MGMKEDVLFIHIPKTGGTTVWNALGIEKIRNAQVSSVPPRKTGKISFGHGIYRDMLGIDLVTPEFLERAYVFSFVRNPYARTVSHWAFSCNTRKFGMYKGFPFGEYIKKGGYMQTLSNHRPQTTFLKDGDFDYIGRMETFAEDLKEIARQIGMGEIEVPHKNKGQRKPYREVIQPQHAEIIEEFYRRDFEELGYEYEEFE